MSGSLRSKEALRQQSRYQETFASYAQAAMVANTFPGNSTDTFYIPVQGVIKNKFESAYFHFVLHCLCIPNTGDYAACMIDQGRRERVQDQVFYNPAISEIVHVEFINYLTFLAANANVLGIESLQFL